MNVYWAMGIIVVTILISLIVGPYLWARRRTHVDPYELDRFLKDPIHFGKEKG